MTGRLGYLPNSKLFYSNVKIAKEHKEVATVNSKFCQVLKHLKIAQDFYNFAKVVKTLAHLVTLLSSEPIFSEFLHRSLLALVSNVCVFLRHRRRRTDDASRIRTRLGLRPCVQWVGR